MTEDELMALPEITDLSYGIVELRNEDGPHDYYRQRSVKIFPSGARQYGPMEFIYVLRFGGVFSAALGRIFNTYLGYHEWERGLPLQQLPSENYDPSLRMVDPDYWVLHQNIFSESKAWQEEGPVARIHNDLIQATLLKIREDWRALPVIPQSSLLK